MHPEHLAKLANLSEQFISDRIRDLRREDLAIARIDDLKVKLFGLIDAYAGSTITIAEGKPIYRARKHRNDKRGARFASVTEIYPNAKYIEHLGRANREHEEIYYFSADRVIALNEVKADAGDTCTILECKPREGASPLLIPIGIHDMAKEQNALIGGGLPALPARMRSYLATDAAFDKHVLIDKFLSHEFLKVVDDDNEYKLTIAMAELLLDFYVDGSRIDGIAYPSIASAKVNANVAFLPSSFHRIYKPVGCTCITIAERRPDFGFAVSEIQAKHIDDQGIIRW